MASGTLNQFVVYYVDSHRKEILKKYKTVADFDQHFTIDNSIMSALRDAGMRDSVKFDSLQYANSEPLIKDITKALIARDVYSDPGAYMLVINHHDDIFLEAMKIINDDRRFRSLLAPPANTETRNNETSRTRN